MRARASLLLGLAFVAACQQGETKPKSPVVVATAPSASTAPSVAPVSVTLPPVPAELGAKTSIVARVRNRHASLFRRGPAEIVLDAGVFEYASKHGGPLERVGELSMYEKDVPSEDLVGPNAGAPSRALRTTSHEEESALDADGTSVTLRNVRVDLGGPEKDTCALVPSSDGHVYGTCRHGEIPLVLRTPNAWVRVPRADALALDTTPRIAVARDGSIWAWEKTPAATPALTRILPDGRKERVLLSRATEDVARPYYDGSYPEMMSAIWSKGPDGAARFWQSTHVELPRVPTDIAAVESLWPQADGSVWTLTYEGGGTDAMVLHTSGSPPPHGLEIGTPFDQQNEVRNAKAPRKWAPGCPQVFVLFDVRANEKAAGQALLVKHQHLAVEVVRGRLFDRVASGVLFLRAEPESNPGAMERAIDKLLTIQGAEAYCGAPVLEQMVVPHPR